MAIRYCDGKPLPPFDVDGNIDHESPNYHEFLEHFAQWLIEQDKTYRKFVWWIGFLLTVGAFIAGIAVGSTIPNQ